MALTRLSSFTPPNAEAQPSYLGYIPPPPSNPAQGDAFTLPSLMASHRSPVTSQTTLVVSSRPDISGSATGPDFGVDIFNFQVIANPGPDISQAYVNNAKWMINSGTLLTEMTFDDANTSGLLVTDLYYESDEPEPVPKMGAGRFQTTWPAAKAGPSPIGFSSPADIPFVAVWPLVTSRQDGKQLPDLLKAVGLTTATTFVGPPLAPQVGAVQLALVDAEVLAHQPQAALASFTLWAILTAPAAQQATGPVAVLLPGPVTIPGGFSRVSSTWSAASATPVGGRLADLEMGTWFVEGPITLLPPGAVGIGVRSWTGVGASDPESTQLTMEARIW